MTYIGEYKVFEEIIQEMMLVYKHDNRPWLIGFSGGKDSTLLCCLVSEMLMRLKKEELKKKIYVVSSDTLVENPIVKKYMHRMSNMIGAWGKKYKIQSDIVYPRVDETFWSKVIGLGYPTPEAPGFRWCTERLKIHPMNDYINNVIKNNGEIVLLTGVRKAESSYRAANIKAREIEGKLLVPHTEIENAYMYNPITELSNPLVWEFLLKDDAKSPWGSDNKYLFTLYQGENLGEEASVLGEVDKDKIPITGNSRFGCWICTMVKEDKSLTNFINHGEKQLIPLRNYRNWLLEIRSDSKEREQKRRNGSMYRKSDGKLGLGPFTMKARKKILERLLELEEETKTELITLDELKQIDEMWDSEGDLTRRELVETYYKIKNKRLPWDEYKKPVFSDEILDEIKKQCKAFDIEYEMISKLIIEIEKNKNLVSVTAIPKAFDKVINQGWLHFDAIEKGLNNENK